MADTYDIVTLDEAKKAINTKVGTADYDTELAAIVTGVSQRIVDLCGPVVYRTFTNETYDGGLDHIVLRNAAIGRGAVTTISSAAEYSTAGTATPLTAENFNTKPANAYLIDAETGIVWRRAAGSASFFAVGRRNLVLTYTSGRAASTVLAPAKFKNATAIMVAHLWRQRGPQAGAFRGETDSGPIYGVAPFAVPRAVTDLLAAEMLPPAVA